MLTDATAAAANEMTTTTGSCLPSWSSAPTRMLPEIASVYAITVVCSEWLTLEMT